jgi:hypothetical protein
MAIPNKTIQSGGANGEYCSFTVVFSTTQMKDKDALELRKQAKLLTEEQSVLTSVERKIDVFVRNGQTVAIFRYDGNIQDFNIRAVKSDFSSALEQMGLLVEVFESKHIA